MSAKPLNGGYSLRRGGRSTLSIVIPENIEGIQEGAAKTATIPADNERDHPKCVVPPSTPSSSMSKTSSFCKKKSQTDTEMSIETPKSSNCTPSISKHRRSLRLSKTSIIKMSRDVKHHIQDPRKLVQRYVGSQTDLTRAGGDSPLCVKKKMGRRGIRHHIKEIDCEVKSRPKNQNTLPTLTKKGVSTLEGASQTSTNSSSKANIQGTILREGNVKQFSCDTKEFPRTRSIFPSGASTSAPHGIEIIDTSADNDGQIPSVLFEESEDFWNTYLLDTYQQIAASNPEVQDFEPIPYPLMARGVPVYIESKDTDGLIIHVERSARKTYATVAPAESIAPLKLEGDINRADDYSGQAESNKAVVGPESWQMNVINRMLQYLDDEKGSPYSKYSIQFQATTTQCTKKHLDGNAKYRHLPGAIFEEIVQTIGGPAFLEIYKKAKTHSGNRFGRAAAVVNPSSETKTKECPSLVQVAVGYGFCLAKSLAADNRSSTSGDNNNIKHAVEHASQEVLQMSKSQCMQFWKEHIFNEDES